MALEDKRKSAQPSRKGKKAWRKNIDHEDVDVGLEAMRTEERVRGKVGELEMDELFTIDTAGDNRVKRQITKDKPLRVDQILAERSAVPGLKSRAVPKPTVTKGEPSKHQKHLVDKYKRKLDNAVAPAAKKKSKNTRSYDLWSEEPAETTNEYLEPVKKHKAPATLSQKPKAAIHQAAVTIPDAGASYNPTEEEHLKLLKKAHDIEVEKLEAQKALDEQLAYRKELEALASELDETIALEELEEAAAAEAEAEDEDTPTKKAAKQARKTTTERNREKRLRQERAIQAQRNQEKKIRQQIDRLKHIEADITTRTEELAQLLATKKQQKAEEEKQGLKRVGKHYVQEMPVEVQLQDELAESLRQLKVKLEHWFHITDNIT
ncbi:ribosome biogenesis protein Nop53/GLTSCR2 [Radiomyces spectabilis]|uniref:ribosome biogenesis protein Nop53/GLTSCR2 n=1 Tax=Radiomyces spectabilis TaxID=64574 RepID=UPI002220A62F|nr:ribosome biogenesis protein Nop53/GLTSCR2 [Radiomyces spectabilis]KAI8374210.1 ribosome biogenesis protein Nop53/GLTSCR2 [Radiomyces spectabilis]